MTDKPDSPHLLAPKIKANYYFAIATNDNQRQPDAKDKLREAFDAAHHPVKTEVYEGCNARLVCQRWHGLQQNRRGTRMG